MQAAAASLGDYSCALVSDGTARCWGGNTYGGGSRSGTGLLSAGLS